MPFSPMTSKARSVSFASPDRHSLGRRGRDHPETRLPKPRRLDRHAEAAVPGRLDPHVQRDRPPSSVVRLQVIQGHELDGDPVEIRGAVPLEQARQQDPDDDPVGDHDGRLGRRLARPAGGMPGPPGGGSPHTIRPRDAYDRGRRRSIAAWPRHRSPILRRGAVPLSEPIRRSWRSGTIRVSRPQARAIGPAVSIARRIPEE